MNVKEPTIEEKAKAYDNLIERLKDFQFEYRFSAFSDTIEKYFPELKESKESGDEKIRKALVRFHKSTIDVDGIKGEDIIAWLEKQGKNNTGISEATKQELEDNLNKALEKETPESWNEFLDESKSTDKVEPKFKVGDIITNGKTIGKVDENENNKYHGWFGYDKDLSVHYADIPDVDNWHLWTIQDAKDGDVLVDSLGNVCIYQEPSTKLMYHSFCYGNYKWFIDGGGSHKIVGTCPATKEQRDLLFQKMKEEGYEWDADKKELKKIIDEKQIKKNLQDNHFRRMFEQESAEWSEENEDVVNKILCICDDFAKSFEISPASTKVVKEDVDKIDKWLKSLRPQSHWKPSDEQMAVLNEVIDYADNSELQHWSNFIYTLLKSLREDLKKLREEYV